MSGGQHTGKCGELFTGTRVRFHDDRHMDILNQIVTLFLIHTCVCVCVSGCVGVCVCVCACVCVWGGGACVMSWQTTPPPLGRRSPLLRTRGIFDPPTWGGYRGLVVGVVDCGPTKNIPL